MGFRAQHAGNALLPFDGLFDASEGRIRATIFANHQEADRARILRRG